MPRPRKKIDEERVLALSTRLATADEIAADQGCAPVTIRRNFDHVLKRGKELGKLSLRHRQFEVAMGQEARPVVYLRTHQNQDGEQYGEIVLGPNGKPIVVDPGSKAVAPSVTMLIWLGKQELNQSDKFQIAEGDGFEFTK